MCRIIPPCSNARVALLPSLAVIRLRRRDPKPRLVGWATGDRRIARLETDLTAHINRQIERKFANFVEDQEHATKPATKCKSSSGETRQ